jgi:hypothetical protein
MRASERLQVENMHARITTLSHYPAWELAGLSRSRQGYPFIVAAADIFGFQDQPPLVFGRSSMEGLAAVGLASNILQFVHFSTKIVSETLKIWRNGEEALKDTKELSIVIAHLQGLLCKLENGRQDGDDATLGELIGQCSLLTKEMLEALDKLGFNNRTGKTARFWESLVLSTKLRLKMSTILELENRVNRLRNAVCTHLNLLL